MFVAIWSPFPQPWPDLDASHPHCLPQASQPPWELETVSWKLESFPRSPVTEGRVSVHMTALDLTL